MKLLLDSHTILWHAADDHRLAQAASDAIEDPTSELFISAATWWELAIKESIGKLSMDGGVEGLYSDWMGNGTATLLPIRWEHLKVNLRLPWLHRDPFVRLLIAQAMAEDVTLLSGDAEIRQYPGLKWWDGWDGIAALPGSE